MVDLGNARINIGGKIKISFLVLIGVIVFTGFFTFLTLNRSVGTINVISEEVNPKNKLYNDFRNLIKDSKAYSTNWVYVKSYENDKRELEEIHKVHYPRLQSKIDSIILLNETDAESLAKIKISFETLLIEQDQIMETLNTSLAYEDPVSVSLSEDLIENTIIPGCDELIDKLDRIIVASNNQAEELNKEMESSFSSLNWVIIILGIIGIAFAIFISSILSTTITKPLNVVLNKIALLSKGEIPEIVENTSRDEIGEIGKGINSLIKSVDELSKFAQQIGRGNLKYEFRPLGENDILGQSLLAMRDNLKTVIDETNTVILEAGTKGRLDTKLSTENKEGAWVELSIAINHLLSSIASPLMEVNKIVTSMADGDLTQEFSIESKGDIERLTTNLGIACINLSDLLSRIAKSAHFMDDSSSEMLIASEEMNSTTDEIASAIAEMSSGAHNQVQKVDESSGLVETILNSSGEMERMAEIINNDAINGVQSTKKGNEMAKHVAKSMEDISEYSAKTSESIKVLTERSKEIGRVLSVITEIASQTNLLALNAAIEAAQAGEAGRGFAVVAEEIRKLAEDSRQSASQIEKLIGSVQQDTEMASQVIETMYKSVKEGESASRQAATVFEEIEASTNRTLSSSKEIFNSSKSQKEAITKVVSITEAVVVIAEQTAAGTEEVASSATELAAGMKNYNQKSKELVEIAEDLKSGIGQFKLKTTS